jgi:hypothetical protein
MMVAMAHDERGLMPVIGLRLLEGRVGSTLLMQLLASAPEVVCDRRYPTGEYRYLSYCVRVAGWMGTPFDPERDVGVTEMLFGPADRGGPLPWHAESLSVERLGPRVLQALWRECSAGFVEQTPQGRLYAEKLACAAEPIVAAGIPLQVIDVVRDPRDVVASMIAFGDRAGRWGFGRKPGQSEAEWIADLIDVFATRLEVALDARRGSTMLLRYEDFAVDLHQTAEALGSWLNVRLDADAALQERADNHITSVSVADSIGRWRRDLDRRAADEIWRALQTKLEPLGYRAD